MNLLAHLQVQSCIASSIKLECNQQEGSDVWEKVEEPTLNLANETLRTPPMGGFCRFLFLIAARDKVSRPTNPVWFVTNVLILQSLI